MYLLYVKILKNKFWNGKLKIIIKQTKIIALAHLAQAEKQTKGTKPSLQLTWAGWYNKQLIIGFFFFNKKKFNKINP